MGQKVNPNGLRLGINKDWQAKWYAKGKDFSKNLEKDVKIREYLTEIQHKSISNKEFFLAKSQKRIKSSFKKSADLNDLFSDVYTDPTSVFIKLANMEKH